MVGCGLPVAGQSSTTVSFLSLTRVVWSGLVIKGGAEEWKKIKESNLFFFQSF